MMMSNESSHMKRDHHSSSGRSNKRSSTNHRTQMSPVGYQFDDKRVPILFWNQNISKNNFTNWKEKLMTYASMNYQYITHILENDQEFPIPVLNPPIPRPALPSQSPQSSTSVSTRSGTAHAAENPGNPVQQFYLDEIEKINYVEELKSRNTLIQKIGSEKLPFFTFTMEHISENSKTILMRSSSFTKIMADKDVLGLWKLLKATHSGVGGGLTDAVIPGEIDKELLDNLDNVKMGDQEFLSTYLKRFKNAIKAYDGTNVTPPNEGLQVAIFIRNLCDSKFRQFKINLRSDFHQLGTEYPKDITSAFNRASNWELDHPTPHRQQFSQPKSTTSTSYHVTAEPMHGNRGRGRGRERGGRRENTGGRKPSTGSNYTCDLCGTLGHYTNHCPRLADAKSAISSNSYHTDVTEKGIYDASRPSPNDVHVY
jgi:hypothetical protein